MIIYLEFVKFVTVHSIYYCRNRLIRKRRGWCGAEEGITTSVVPIGILPLSQLLPVFQSVLVPPSQSPDVGDVTVSEAEFEFTVKEHGLVELTMHLYEYPIS